MPSEMVGRMAARQQGNMRRNSMNDTPPRRQRRWNSCRRYRRAGCERGWNLGGDASQSRFQGSESGMTSSSWGYKKRAIWR